MGLVRGGRHAGKEGRIPEADEVPTSGPQLSKASSRALRRGALIFNIFLEEIPSTGVKFPSLQNLAPRLAFAIDNK